MKTLREILAEAESRGLLVDDGGGARPIASYVADMEKYAPDALEQLSGSYFFKGGGSAFGGNHAALSFEPPPAAGGTP